MSDVLLQVNNLKTWFDTRAGRVTVVDDISFTIRKGETFAILGESGCGKSMTALSLMQLLPSQASQNISGQVILDNQDLLALPESAMRNVRGNKIAMIFQEPMSSLNPVMSVERQIGEVLQRHKNLRGLEEKQKILELLQQVGIPAPEQRMKEFPHQLSGGMKQRVMIAIALAGDPDLLIADEPTTALDVTIQAQVLDLLKKLQKEMGMAVLMISHDLAVVSEMVDHVAVMYAGQIVEIADRNTFFSNPSHPYSKKLFEALPSMSKRDEALAIIPGSVPSLNQTFSQCRFSSRCQNAFETCSTNPPKLLDINNEHYVRCFLYEELGDKEIDKEVAAGDNKKYVSSASDKALLKVNNIKVHFPIREGLFKRLKGHVFAVDDVSLNLNYGQTLALVGESGCGKTTLGKGILQLLDLTAGEVEFENTKLTDLTQAELRDRRKDFQIVFQDPFSSMNPRMMVGDIIEEGMIAQNIGASEDERRKRVEELLVQVGLQAEFKNRYPHEFSGGQRQRICVARALAVNPKLIVCDEPTSALDVSVQAQILNLLKELQQDFNLAYLFITHNISVVAYLADEVAVMYLGKIVERGTTEEVLENPKHPYTIALLSAVPSFDHEKNKQVVRLEGDPPSPINPPSGCHFHPRCPQVREECKQSYPSTTQISKTQVVNCFLHGK